MLQVALAHTAALVKPWAPSYILGGCSMGAAAAALWTHKESELHQHRRNGSNGRVMEGRS